MQAIFHILKDIQARSVQSSKSHAELSADIKGIATSQKIIEAKIGFIEKCLDTLEEKTEAVDRFEQDMTTFRGSMETLASQHGSMQARLDELEDRSRCNNLICHGLSDWKVSWEQSEKHIKSILTSAIDSLTDNDIERAHRLGSYMENKCRLMIVKFSNNKMKDKVLSARIKLK